jgi:hypothetical protein
MHPAARLQFERMIGEYARWRAVPEKERSPAPAWWWGPAVELRNAQEALPQEALPQEALPAEWCAELGLPDHATWAAAAETFLRAFEGQTALPWPYDFPRKTEITDPTVRELHPQPSDDSAFQP